MSKAAGAMAALQAQQEAQLAQQMAIQGQQMGMTHQTKMMETATQGERARANIVEKLGNDFNADAASQMKNAHDSASSASAA